MADMAPALTGAAQEAPHRLSASSWKARSGLLLLNGGEKGRAAREDGVPGPGDKTLRALMEEPGTDGVPGPRTAIKASTGPLKILQAAPGPAKRTEGSPGPRTKAVGLPGPIKKAAGVPGPIRRALPVLGPIRKAAAVPVPIKKAPGSMKKAAGASGPAKTFLGEAMKRPLRGPLPAGEASAPTEQLEASMGLSAVQNSAPRSTPGSAMDVPSFKNLSSAQGSTSGSAMDIPTSKDSTFALRPMLGPEVASCKNSTFALGPNTANEKRKDGLELQERTGESAPGPATPSAPLGNAKSHLAGQDLALEPIGRTEAISGQPAPPDSALTVDPSVSHGCVPGSQVSNSLLGSLANHNSAPGPVDPQDATPVPRVLCALRAAQMSSRQQELGARARRLCRRLQVIQAKQVERHVRQQLSGLAELLSERGAAGLPGSPHIELDRLACSSTARLRAAQGGFDSDATESSSGGESDTEEAATSSEQEREEEEQSQDTGSFQHTEWRWAVERAAIICRWTWLQAQVSDLEFRIRQQTEIYKQIRSTKGTVVLGESPHCEDSRQTAGSSTLNARGNRVPFSCTKPTPRVPLGDDPCHTPTPPPQSLDKQCSRLTPSVENVACQNPPTTPVCDPLGSQKTPRQVNGLINCVRSSVSCNGSTADVDQEEVLGKKRRVDSLPSSPALSDSTCVAARTRPLRGHKKRSLVRSSEVSSLSRKPQKPLSVKCGCDPPTTCILCGCKTYAKTSHPSTMSLNERIGLMDPCYHPILSFHYDTPLHLHFEALLKEDRQFRVSNKLKILKLAQLTRKPQDAVRSLFRDDRQYKGVSSPGINVSSPVTPRPNPAGQQPPSLTDTPPAASQQNSASAALKRKRFENSYDIDNIVIPMSLVAASRVEKLQYKEILTPSWRVLDSTEMYTLEVDPQLEDLSNETYQERHSANEEIERSRWDSWTSALPQRRGSRSSNKSDGRWTPQPPNSQGSSQLTASPDIRFQSLNDVPLSLSSAASDNPEPYNTVQCLSLHGRTRVLSWSEDTRSSTPDIPDEEEQIIQPWEHRSFPLTDRDYHALEDLPETPIKGRTKPQPDVSWQMSGTPATWTESIDSGTSTENLTPASKESPLPNSISVVRVRAHSGDKIASLEYLPPRPVNKR